MNEANAAGNKRQRPPKRSRRVKWLLALFAAATAGVLLDLRVTANLRQERLNERLLSAIKEHNSAVAIRCLDDGADPNAESVPESVSNVRGWRRIWSLIRGDRPQNHDLSSRPILQLFEGEFLILSSSPERQSMAHPPDPPLLQALLAHGADANVRGDNGTPLALSAWYGDESSVRILLEHGADPNDVVEGSEAGLALNSAAERGDNAIVRMLLKHHADPNRSTLGYAPLMAAARQSGDSQTVALLLTAGADINAQNRSGKTALMYAAEADRAAMVRLLLDAGADRSIQNDDGKTAIDLAREAGHFNVAGELQRAIGRR